MNYSVFTLCTLDYYHYASMTHINSQALANKLLIRRVRLFGDSLGIVQIIVNGERLILGSHLHQTLHLHNPKLYIYERQEGYQISIRNKSFTNSWNHPIIMTTFSNNKFISLWKIWLKYKTKFALKQKLPGVKQLRASNWQRL